LNVAHAAKARLEEELEQLRKSAEKNHRSMNGEVLSALEYYFKHQEQEKRRRT